jgi:hypothetical protein
MTPNTGANGQATPEAFEKPIKGFKGSAVGGTSSNTY